jgi:hypothetical protein
VDTSCGIVTRISCARVTIAATKRANNTSNRGIASRMETFVRGITVDWDMQTQSIRLVAGVDRAFVGIAAVNRGILTPKSRRTRVSGARVIVSASDRCGYTSSTRASVRCAEVIVVTIYRCMSARTSTNDTRNSISGAWIIVIAIQNSARNIKRNPNGGSNPTTRLVLI